MTDKKKSKGKLKPGRRPTHGGYVFLRSSLISKDNRHVALYLSAMRASYIEELGPKEEDLSTGQVILLNQLTTCIGFCRLVEENARKTENIQYLRTKHYMQFMKHGRQLCLDLGLNPDKTEAPVYLEDM